MTPSSWPSCGHRPVPTNPSVTFEVWDSGGSQPPNSHPRSVETFFFLKGQGIATSDGAGTPVRAGQLLVLRPVRCTRSATPARARLYALTTMWPDDGFAEMVASGPLDELDDEDLAVLRGVR